MIVLGLKQTYTGFSISYNRLRAKTNLYGIFYFVQTIRFVKRSYLGVRKSERTSVPSVHCVKTVTLYLTSKDLRGTSFLSPRVLSIEWWYRRLRDNEEVGDERWKTFVNTLRYSKPRQRQSSTGTQNPPTPHRLLNISVERRDSGFT